MHYLPVEADQMYVCANCGETYNRNDSEPSIIGGEPYCEGCVSNSDDLFDRMIEEDKKGAVSA